MDKLLQDRKLLLEQKLDSMKVILLKRITNKTIFFINLSLIAITIVCAAFAFSNKNGSFSLNFKDDWIVVAFMLLLISFLLAMFSYLWVLEHRSKKVYIFKVGDKRHYLEFVTKKKAIFCDGNHTYLVFCNHKKQNYKYINFDTFRKQVMYFGTAGFLFYKKVANKEYFRFSENTLNSYIAYTLYKDEKIKVRYKFFSGYDQDNMKSYRTRNYYILNSNKVILPIIIKDIYNKNGKEVPQGDNILYCDKLNFKC